MDKQNFVTFMSENGMTSESATQMYNDLVERFGGDWEKVAEYLENLLSYLQEHQ